MINFGALVAFSFVNLSMIKHFLIDEKRRGMGDWICYGALPTIGFMLTVWLWTSLLATTFEVGLIWVALGFLYLTSTLHKYFDEKYRTLQFKHLENHFNDMGSQTQANNFADGLCIDALARPLC